MFKKGCEQCSEISISESNLDQRSVALTDRVKKFRKEVCECNNKKWQKFAIWCNVPFLGNIILKNLKIPFGLELYPEHCKEEWYGSEGNLIQVESRKLEIMKASHLEHWGDEIVSPADHSDPGGYYTPNLAPRSECYARGAGVFTPEKYDFHSGAGVSKYRTEELVVCSDTKQLVPVNNCIWEIGVRTRWKPIYRSERSNTNQLGFNEWRDPSYYPSYYIELPRNS